MTKIEINANIMLLGIGDPESNNFIDECYYDYFILGDLTNRIFCRRLSKYVCEVS